MPLMKRMFPAFLLLIFSQSITLYSQPKNVSSDDLLHRLQKLRVLGSVLYVAAHPDDENTLAIGYFANERLMTTAYLSMTRGDGGQNLIGGELRDRLGLIRTQELLAARKVDGGRQFFTRANDFGFSKTPEETLRIWDKQSILSDVVMVIRQFRPDVMITRFPPDARAGHGHHTSSALLALEAFDLASDPSAFPEQVSAYGTWKPKRLYLNLSRFFAPSVNESTPGVFTIDMGGYNPLLGKSYPELSAQSRTMHKSQGFGSRARRGPTPEFFEYQKGERAEKDLLEGINTGWSRVEGGQPIDGLISKTIDSFNPQMPWKSIQQLVSIRKSIESIGDPFWKQRKLEEVNTLISDCLGIYFEITADHYYVSAGYQSAFNLEIVNRSPIPIQLKRLIIKDSGLDTMFNVTLRDNQQMIKTFKRPISSSLSPSGPYWLNEKHSDGLFMVRDTGLIGKPEASSALTANMVLEVEGITLNMETPVVFKSLDPVKGELYRPVQTTPPLKMSFGSSLLFFSGTKPLSVDLTISPVVNRELSGELKLEVPSGWAIQPASIPITFKKRGELQSIKLTISPPAKGGEGWLRAVGKIGDQTYATSIEEINYDHIPVQTIQSALEVKLVSASVLKIGKSVAYVRGAGDDIPAALTAIGYDVTEFSEVPSRAEDLFRFDAVVLGIRALNTNESLSTGMASLFKYVEQGGVMINQYNTNSDFKTDKIAPLPLTLGRERVTEEEAEVRFLAPEHPVLNTPNKITSDDFKGWVQERGLYFGLKWDDGFVPIISMNDKGEPARNGGLLIARYGKGFYVYTGLSFFRQLPEGVSGAYRLFANLVSLGNSSDQKSQPAKK